MSNVRLDAGRGRIRVTLALAGLVVGLLPGVSAATPRWTDKPVPAEAAAETGDLADVFAGPR